MKETIGRTYTLPKDFFSKNEEKKESIKLRAETFNKEGDLCGFIYEDLTTLDLPEETLRLIIELIEKTGYTVNIERGSYRGIYDPPRTIEVIEIKNRDSTLYESEIRELNFWLKHYKEKSEKSKKRWWRWWR